MFLKRLKTVLTYVLGIPAVAVGMFGLAYLISLIPHIETILNVIIWFILFPIFGLVFALVIIGNIYEFIKWLFIEPYKFWKASKKVQR